jgi:hypothetical protein
LALLRPQQRYRIPRALLPRNEQQAAAPVVAHLQKPASAGFFNVWRDRKILEITKLINQISKMKHLDTKINV